VEADETFIGGRSRFMHKDKRAPCHQVPPASGARQPSWELLERTAPTRAQYRPGVRRQDVRKPALQENIRQNSRPERTSIPDAHRSYQGL